ncbi:MAG TPA: heme-binding protein [Pyrinomonadaceae bacterium]|nr:heme-binding protein [Pyrinomonadaceae bacterium]
MKSNLRMALTTLIVFSTAILASAQTVERKSLTIDGAKKVIAAAVAYAKKNNAPGGVVAVVDDGGNLMALERLDGTFAAGANISIGKARTAVLFKRPTKVFEDIIKNGRTAMVALPDAYFTPLQGGVPISIDGQIVGGVGVSGASSAQQDEELALAGANVFSGDAKMGDALMKTSPVLFFDKSQVSASFSKGAVLLDGTNRNYMVHTSRRDQPGQAEIHALDTDIIYVMEGTATFVTGGTAIEPTEIAPNEIRGSRIEGGETRKLSKGDVIIVPNNTPHWFKEVGGAFLYYTIKVR